MIVNEFTHFGIFYEIILRTKWVNKSTIICDILFYQKNNVLISLKNNIMSKLHKFINLPTLQETHIHSHWMNF